MNINLERAQKIEGWMRDAELQWLAEKVYSLASDQRILEIGSWCGRSTVAMADNTAAVITAVDTWKGTPNEHERFLVDKPKEWLWKTFQKNTGMRKVEPFRGPSRDFFRQNDLKFDFIFIDGSHYYNDVRIDIIECAKILAPGGILCGHDYSSSFPDVVRAVKELLPKAHPAKAGSIWVNPPWAR